MKPASESRESGDSFVPEESSQDSFTRSKSDAARYFWCFRPSSEVFDSGICLDFSSMHSVRLTTSLCVTVYSGHMAAIGSEH